MADEEIRSLASFLNVSCGKISISKDPKVVSLQLEKGVVIKGLVSIAKYLTSKSENTELLGGNDLEKKANVNQWLEYRVSQVDHAVNEKDICATLKELNEYLSERVYVVGFHLTVADVVLFYGLQDIYLNLTFVEKQKYINLSRWYNQVQHLPRVNQNMRNVHFQKSLIYSNTSQH